MSSADCFRKFRCLLIQRSNLSYGIYPFRSTRREYFSSKESNQFQDANSILSHLILIKVLIDHGLYCAASPEFSRKYAVFWKSLVLGDMAKLQEIATSWGIPDVSIFASITLQKRWTKGEPERKRTGDLTKEERFERQKMVKKRVQEFLGNTEIIPKFDLTFNDMQGTHFHWTHAEYHPSKQ
jgi:hypothetical protein